MVLSRCHLALIRCRISPRITYPDSHSPLGLSSRSAFLRVRILAILLHLCIRPVWRDTTGADQPPELHPVMLQLAKLPTFIRVLLHEPARVSPATLLTLRSSRPTPLRVSPGYAWRETQSPRSVRHKIVRQCTERSETARQLPAHRPCWLPH